MALFNDPTELGGTLMHHRIDTVLLENPVESLGLPMKNLRKNDRFAHGVDVLRAMKG